MTLTQFPPEEGREDSVHEDGVYISWPAAIVIVTFFLCVTGVLLAVIL